jgi:hypothetical protein
MRPEGINMARHMESINSKERLLTSVTLSGAVLLSAAIMTDMQVGAKAGKGRSDKAEVITNIRDGEYSTFTVPGYHANGRVIGQVMDRHLESMGTTHYAVHPEKGFNLDSIREEWLRARDLDGHRPARIYAMSMGALLVSKLFSDPEFRYEFGEVNTLVMDSGLSSKDDVHFLSKLAMAAGIVLPVTYTTGKLYGLINSQEAKRKAHHSIEITDEEAHELVLSSAQTPYYAAKDQVLFMNKYKAENMNLAPFAHEIGGKILYLASLSDHVLDPWQAANNYCVSMDHEMEYRIDTSRMPGEHATGPERVHGVIDALLGQNPDKYRIITLGPELPKAQLKLTRPIAA